MNKLKEDLIKIGLTESQSKIYLSLLKLSKATIKEIAKDCGFHRTNIYDIIEELKERGLITYVKEGKSAIYSAVDPKNLALIIDEKKEVLNNILPSLENIFRLQNDLVNVQVYKGEQGMKIAFNNIVRNKNITYYGLNIQGQLREQLPVYAKQFYRKMRENNVRYKAIYTKEYKILKDYEVKEKNIEIRYISKKYSTPVATMIYKDIILIQTWSPSMIAIEIKSKQIAEAYKDHFKIMWEDASKKQL